jgi:hypothetical protein
MRSRALNGSFSDVPLVFGLDVGGEGNRDRMVVTLARCHL